MSVESSSVPDLPIPPVHDIGVSEIYVPSQPIEAVADVVFIHGLMGHPVKTWLYGHASKADSLCYWPFHLLPSDFENIRILTYGYDSSPTHWYKQGTNQMTISQHADNLLFMVAMKRNGCTGRPLIFVAHSLGGVLVKSALNESRHMQYRPFQADVLKSCRAIFFFGTPHLGATIASWGEVMTSIVGAIPGGVSTYGEVLRGLSPDSETLYNITKRFNELLNEPIHPTDKIQICSFQEGKGMLPIRGGGSKVVPDYSSALNRTDIEQSFSVQDGNHVDMCRFSSNRALGYRMFSAMLSHYLQAVSERVAPGEPAELTSDSAGLLKDLDFDDRLDREHQLARLRTNDESFEWVWSSDFVPWLRSDQPLFWIVGHPASGKSTLTRYLSSNIQTKQILEDHFESEVLIIRFFFDYRADKNIRNNFSGFKRSLLYQILESLPTVAQQVERQFHLKRQNSHEWLGNDTRLMKILEYALGSLNRRALLLIDGLDEYSGDKPDLLNLVDAILAAGVKICLASRDEHVFRVRLRDEPSVRMDRFNRPGIVAYSKKTLASSLRPQTEQDHRTIEHCSSLIAEKSNGVFLWARFAVLEIIDKIGEDIIYHGDKGLGLGSRAVQEILTQLPPSLEDIYDRVFAAKDDKDKSAYGVILRLITTSLRAAVYLSELYEACVITRVYPPPHTSEKAGQLELASFNRYVLRLGLVEASPQIVEITGSAEPRSMFLRRQSFKIIHRSVDTYLDKKGWVKLLNQTRAEEPPNLLWVEILTQFLQGTKVSWEKFISDGSWKAPAKHNEGDSNKFKFMQGGLEDYAEISLGYHAGEFEMESRRSCRNLINPVLTPSYLQAHQLVVYAAKEWMQNFDPAFHNVMLGSRSALLTPTLDSGPYFAILHGLEHFIKEEISQGSIDPSFSQHGNEAARMIFFDVFARHLDGPVTWYEYSKAIKHQPLSLLEFATMNFSMQRGREPERSRIMEMIADTSPHVSDECLLLAIAGAPLRNLKMLLRNFAPGKLQLRLKPLSHGQHPKQPSLPHSESLMTFGPLSIAACRALNDHALGPEVLDLFLKRGEDINLQCSPFGSAIHGLVPHFIGDHHFYDGAKKFSATLDLLTSHGADLKATGPYGNALELLWTIITTNQMVMKHYELENSHTLAEILASKGLESQSKDENGNIVTLEEMKRRILERIKKIEDKMTRDERALREGMKRTREKKA